MTKLSEKLANASVKDAPKMVHERRYEFVLERAVPAIKGYSYWICSLGEYDDGAPIATGATPQEAMAEWLELHGDQIDGDKL